MSSCINFEGDVMISSDNDVMSSSGGTQPRMVLITGSSQSSSVSSCSSRETVRSVGKQDTPPRDVTGEHTTTTTTTTTMVNSSDNELYDNDDVFSELQQQQQMAEMSPLVNRWRRQQTGNDVISSQQNAIQSGWRNNKNTGMKLSQEASRRQGRGSLDSVGRTSSEDKSRVEMVDSRSRTFDAPDTITPSYRSGSYFYRHPTTTTTTSTTTTHIPSQLQQSAEVWQSTHSAQPSSPTTVKFSALTGSSAATKNSQPVTPGSSGSRWLDKYTATFSRVKSDKKSESRRHELSGISRSVAQRTATVSADVSRSSSPPSRKFDDKDEEAMSPVVSQSRPTSSSISSSPLEQMELNPWTDTDLPGVTGGDTGAGLTSTNCALSATLPTTLQTLEAVPHLYARLDETSAMSRSAVFCSPQLEERRTAEINRLRQDLKWAKDQVQLLTSRLSTNVGVVEAFDQSLCNMSRRLDRLASSSQFTNVELNELQTTINSLRRQNWSQLPDKAPTSVDHLPAYTANLSSRVPSSLDHQLPSVKLSTAGTHTSTAVTIATVQATPTHTALMSRSTIEGVSTSEHRVLHRQTSAESVSSVTSATSGVSAFSLQTDSEFKRGGSVKNWLRSSFGKAFSRKKRDHGSSPSVNKASTGPGSGSESGSGSGSRSGSARVNNNMSHTCSMPTIADQKYWNTSSQPQYTVSARGSFDSVYSEDSTPCRTPAHLAALSCNQNPSSYTAKTQMTSLLASMTSPRHTADDSCHHSNRTHKRSESLDQKLGALRSNRQLPSVTDLLRSSDKSSTVGRHVTVSVVIYSTNSPHVEKANHINIGVITVDTHTTWSQLDAIVRRTFQNYLIKLDPATSLGLSAESVSCYRLAEICRNKDCDQPELLPIGYLVGDVTDITVTLRGGDELDEMAFELLIPKLILQRYINLLLEHRRVILSGSTGTGKTFLAQRLAQFLVHRCESSVTTDSIALFQVDNQSGRELRQYLLNIATQCSAEVGGTDNKVGRSSGLMGGVEGGASHPPTVIILDDLHRVTSLSDVFSGFLSVPYQYCPYVIGTMNQTSACSAADLQMHHNFRWVLYANHIEPVRSFLGRYLRRQLISIQTDDNLPPSLDRLSAVIDWIPRVWQRINKFLEAHSSSDITIGPRLFLACPMDLCKAEGWFADLWNYSIVPYLLEAVRDGIHSYGSHGPWDELADWIIASYPWKSASSSLFKLSSGDVTTRNNTGADVSIQ